MGTPNPVGQTIGVTDRIRDRPANLADALLVRGGCDLDLVERIHLRDPNLLETNQFKQREKRHDNLNPRRNLREQL